MGLHGNAELSAALAAAEDAVEDALSQCVGATPSGGASAVVAALRAVDACEATLSRLKRLHADGVALLALVRSTAELHRRAVDERAQLQAVLASAGAASQQARVLAAAADDGEAVAAAQQLLSAALCGPAAGGDTDARAITTVFDELLRPATPPSLPAVDASQTSAALPAPLEHLRLQADGAVACIQRAAAELRAAASAFSRAHGLSLTDAARPLLMASALDVSGAVLSEAASTDRSTAAMADGAAAQAAVVADALSAARMLQRKTTERATLLAAARRRRLIAGAALQLVAAAADASRHVGGGDGGDAFGGALRAAEIAVDAYCASGAADAGAEAALFCALRALVTQAPQLLPSAAAAASPHRAAARLSAVSPVPAAAATAAPTARTTMPSPVVTHAAQSVHIGGGGSGSEALDFNDSDGDRAVGTGVFAGIPSPPPIPPRSPPPAPLAARAPSLSATSSTAAGAAGAQLTPQQLQLQELAAAVAASGYGDDADVSLTL